MYGKKVFPPMTARVISELYYKWKWRIIENCLRHRIPRHAKKKCLASTVVFSLTLNSGFEILHQPQKGEKYKITKVTWNNCSNLFWFIVWINSVFLCLNRSVKKMNCTMSRDKRFSMKLNPWLSYFLPQWLPWKFLQRLFFSLWHLHVSAA